MARWWGPNVKINGDWLRENDDNYTRWMGADAEQWETEVQSEFRKLETSKTGKLLVGLINGLGTGKRLDVIPIRAANFRQTSAKPTDWTPSMKQGHKFDCPASETCSNRPIKGLGVAPHSDLITGQGSGGNVRLYFHPSSWTAADQTKAVDVAAGIDTLANNVQPDDVLFHELVHAYRAMKGIFEFVPTGDTWDATEEFFAIVLANIYVSETRPAAELRGDHNIEFHSLAKAGQMTSDQAFYLKNITLMEQLIKEMPELTGPLSETAKGKEIGAWNPLRFSRRIDETRDMWSSGPAYLDLMSR